MALQGRRLLQSVPPILRVARQAAQRHAVVTMLSTKFKTFSGVRPITSNINETEEVVFH